MFLFLYSRSASFQGYGAALASFASRTKQLNSRQDTMRLWANEGMLMVPACEPYAAAWQSRRALGHARRGKRITNAKRHSALDGRIVSRGRSQLLSPLERFTGAVHESRPQREKTCWKSSLTKSRSANALRLLECVEKTDYNPSCFWYCASSEGEQ